MSALLTKEKYEYKVSEKEISHLTQAVIKTLLYFDIFQHPLTVEEIHEYCQGYDTSKSEIESQLEVFEGIGYVSCYGGFYQIRSDNMASLVERRCNGNREAKRFIKIANKVSKFISWFPFVRGICLSGSLSKGYADKDSDIDYFIITEPGRLWIARTMLILFKKLFLFNSHKYFCVNYFIDTESLEIPDRNLFTATELLSIIPVSNLNLYQELMAANSWIKEYFPNGKLKTEQPVLTAHNGIIKRGIEKLFASRFGDRVDDFCFRLTLKQWKKKFNHFNSAEFDLKLRTRKNVSKHHPNGFQLLVMKQFDEKVKSFEEKFNISLS